MPTEALQLDLSDLDRRVGKPVGGAQMREPCSRMEIRRWAMGMDYPNPLHWDEAFARRSKFGDLVAPQSMVTSLDYGQGMQACFVGCIPETHVLMGGDEWWFYGAPVRPGDSLSQTRRFLDYRYLDTRFAGPTVISRGETVHRNQHGGLVARQRTTAIRYLAAEAERRRAENPEPVKQPVWTREALDAAATTRRAWILSNREGVSPRFDAVQVGQVLPPRVIGPHTIATFATEWRAFGFTVWGAAEWGGVPGDPDAWVNQDHGLPAGMKLDYEEAKIDPRVIDGLYSGPAAGHVDTKVGATVGISRAYGYGASMGAWGLDYLAYWAGHEGMVRHARFNFRAPTFEGDVTLFHAEVAAKQPESEWGTPLVSVKLKMTDQDGLVLVDGVAEVELPV
jgi:acyl dehydratase